MMEECCHSWLVSLVERPQLAITSELAIDSPSASGLDLPRHGYLPAAGTAKVDPKQPKLAIRDSSAPTAHLLPGCRPTIYKQAYSAKRLRKLARQRAGHSPPSELFGPSAVTTRFGACSSDPKICGECERGHTSKYPR